MGDINIKLKESADKLAAKINDIKAIATPSELHSYSDLIMGMIRAEHVFIQKKTIAKYVNGDKGYTTATLHPEDLSTIPSGNWSPIFANSFGPWRPKDYFNLKGDWTEPRILWLLKESYITNTWNDKNDRGGHNQVYEYFSWDDLEYDTHINIVEMSKAIIDTLFCTNHKQTDVMKHLCILEISHFPGIAIKNTVSDDTIIPEWAKINTNLLTALIDFYAPNIIIGDRIVLWSLTNDLFNWLASKISFDDADFSKNDDYTILQRRCIPIKNYRKEIFNRATKEMWKNYTTAVVDDKQNLWINCNYHPSCRDWNDKNSGKNRASSLANWIKDILVSNQFI